MKMSKNQMLQTLGRPLYFIRYPGNPHKGVASFFGRSYMEEVLTEQKTPSLDDVNAAETPEEHRELLAKNITPYPPIEKEMSKKTFDHYVKHFNEVNGLSVEPKERTFRRSTDGIGDPF